jgi:hypothetical protein
MTTAHNAVSALAVQAMGAEMAPSRSSASLMTPNWSCSIQFHMRAETTVGIAQGMRTMARMSPRPGNAGVEGEGDDGSRAPFPATPRRA